MSTAEDFAAWLADTHRSVSHQASMAVQYHPDNPDELATMLAHFNASFNEIETTMSDTASNHANATEVALWADRMGYHKANHVTVPKHRELRAVFISTAEFIINTVPAGRERALALTALQESLMWSNAAVAINLAPVALDD